MRLVTRARLKSPWILHFDCGSCNGCDIEILAALTPKFDAERLGVVNIGDPKQADVIVVTGPANPRSARALRSLYEQTPDPKVVVAVGACAATGGVFRNCENVFGGVDKVIPVDVYVPGCAARPEQIIDGLLLALRKLKEKDGG
ncbi:MAG: NADH-quinone oxidoreductase subunit NuoB [Candidatus Verstraetearchaeota archaeon]|nr:NADH-quinone oxidoreductase subunit NuoB [Candidatus Verstraetearchaeota archaeon]